MKGTKLIKKPSNLQVLYIRKIDDKKEYVPQTYGRRNRFISLDNTNDDITFKSLPDRAIDLLFPNGKKISR